MMLFFVRSEFFSQIRHPKLLSADFLAIPDAAPYASLHVDSLSDYTICEDKSYCKNGQVSCMVKRVIKFISDTLYSL